MPGEAPPGAEPVRLAPVAPAISTSSLTKRYGDRLALDGLDLEVPRGLVFGFLGPNGAGKTTAVKLLLGLARPTGGEGRVLGAPLGDRPIRSKVGYLPELFRYQGWLSAREALVLHCQLAGLPQHQVRDEVERGLEVVGLEGRGDDQVATFSKGMQQRLGLAVALLGTPELVILDEPTSALDPVGRHDVREIIRKLRADGVTVFLNSHFLSEVELVCDRVAIVDRGKVVAQGGLAELLEGGGPRVRCTGLTVSALDRLGELRTDGDWVWVEGLDSSRTPDLVEALVGVGARVHQVEEGRRSLEERFLQLLERP